MPAARNPLIARSGLFSISCQVEIIQLALKGLIAAAVTLTFTMFNGISLSYFWTSLAYQVWNLVLIPSFTGLLIDTSISCNLSVQSGGICTAIMLFFCNSDWMAAVVWPQKQSNNTRAVCDFSRLKSWHCWSMKGTMICSTYRCMVSSFDQWFSECQMSHPFGKITGGWQRFVFPLKISWGGRYLPAIEAARTTVIWRLSSELAMGITFSPAWCMVHSPVGTSGTPVWSQLMMCSSGMSFISTCALTSAKKTSWISVNCVGDIFPALEHFLFTYPIRLSRDFAQVFVMVTYPPWELSLVISQDGTMPTAACCHYNGRVDNCTCCSHRFDVLLDCLVKLLTKKKRPSLSFCWQAFTNGPSGSVFICANTCMHVLALEPSRSWLLLFYDWELWISV